MKNRILQVLVVLPALLFLVTGLRWLFDPAGAAPTLGFTLEQGLGLSSQVGDLTGFFVTLGACMLLALITGQRTWYYPAMMLLLLAALGRTVAWAVHGAPFASAIAVEIVVAAILLVASRTLPEKA